MPDQRWAVPTMGGLTHTWYVPSCLDRVRDLAAVAAQIQALVSLNDPGRREKHDKTTPT